MPNRFVVVCTPESIYYLPISNWVFAGNLYLLWQNMIGRGRATLVLLLPMRMKLYDVLSLVLAMPKLLSFAIVNEMFIISL